MHIYAFGSICRGEVDHSSDVDLLAIVNKYDNRFDPSIYSIYSYDRIKDLWLEGNPFAWHLSVESKILFSSDGTDFIRNLGNPVSYKNMEQDCTKFYNLFMMASSSFNLDGCSAVFELSTIFLAIRNFATCYSLGKLQKYNFSRYSAQRLDSDSLSLSSDCFSILERSRILSTRGTGIMITPKEIQVVTENIDFITQWMNDILGKVNRNE